jgi:hypothetical protein
VFAQGALDGGLNIPHNEKRFVGWTKEEGLEAEVLKKYIYGGHVAEYMEEMEEEDPEKYNRWVAQGRSGSPGGGGGEWEGQAAAPAVEPVSYGHNCCVVWGGEGGVCVGQCLGNDGST